MRLRITLLFLLFCTTPLFGGLRDAVDAIKIITVRSISQKILNKNRILFEGNVEILLDYKIHIWADSVEIDNDEKKLVARAGDSGFVTVENSDLVMLADYIELYLEKKTGCARNIKIHVKEGFLSSEKAEKLDNQTWQMKRITYTACDRAKPHWAFFAHKAVLYKNSVLKASGLVFRIYNIPLFAFPALIFPLQNRAGSGFLMPRLSFDAELGFGFRQEYYWLLGSHCDTTIGFYLIEKKGFVLSDEFRWARSPSNFLIINSNYAEEWNAMLERRRRIIRATERHYWVQGKYFQPFDLGSMHMQSLIRFDFGTDKRIGFHFLNDVERVEDSFYNTVIQRYRDENNIMQCMVHSERCLRKQFVEVSSGEKKEREEKVSVAYLPHYEWSTRYYEFIPHLFYRHDVTIDQLFLESRDIEKTYIDDVLDNISKNEPSYNADTGRFLYRGVIRSHVRTRSQELSFFVEPHLQLRSNIRKNMNKTAHSKMFLKTGIEWSLPERVIHSKNYKYMHYIHPMFRWTYLPKFYQKHWYYIDRLDRAYPENKLSFILRNNWKIDQVNIDLLAEQHYDFYNKSDILPLYRCYNGNHLSPLRLQLNFYYDWDDATCSGVDVSFAQEYSWRSLSLIQSEISASVNLNDFSLFLGYLYQKRSLQKARMLFSDIPAFAIFGITVPAGKKLRFHYDGSFYSKYKHLFPILNTMKPMLHRFRLDYEGHCWGASIGWEEKRYRQYGTWKSERAITFALRLESIGSFAQKFRRPIISRAPSEYRG